MKRNQLCPCGSGRKFKKCCMPVKADANGTDLGEGKRRVPMIPARALQRQKERGAK